MRVILSRKGFDSSYGGIPSPIFPDGIPLSFPIPNKVNNVRYSDLSFRNFNLNNLIEQLSHSGKYRGVRKWHNITSDTKCHLDPDIYRDLKSRPQSWRPLFGQVGKSQSHLDKQKIGKDDLFLFFGWFRHVHIDGNQYRYIPTAPDIHLIFGYFQVDYIINTSDALKDWMKYHPHYESIESKISNDTIYVARNHSTFNNNLPGAGWLAYNPIRVLTREGFSRSKWNLPDYLRKTKISYHSEVSWEKDYFQSARIGQEFVFQDTQEARNWAKSILM